MSHWDDGGGAPATGFDISPPKIAPRFGPTGKSVVLTANVNVVSIGKENFNREGPQVNARMVRLLLVSHTPVSYLMNC